MSNEVARLSRPSDWCDRVPSTKSDAWEAEELALVTDTSAMLSARIARVLAKFGIGVSDSGMDLDSGADGARDARECKTHATAGYGLVVICGAGRSKSRWQHGKSRERTGFETHPVIGRGVFAAPQASHFGYY